MVRTFSSRAPGQKQLNTGGRAVRQRPTQHESAGLRTSGHRGRGWNYWTGDAREG